MTPTSKHSFFLPIEPFPAERTQCACRGRFPTVYNKAKYKEWLARAIELLHDLAPEDLGPARASPVIIEIEVVRPKPKTSKLYAPLGDTDNYEKGVWDAITKAGHWWEDDRQIIENHTWKRWAKPGEPEGYHVRLEFLTDEQYSG